MKKDLLDYFFHKDFDKFIGFEVSDRFVKAIYLKKFKNRLILQDGALYELKANVISDNQINDTEKLIDAFIKIKEDLLINKADFPIGISFPGQFAVSKVLKINKNIAEAEQEKYIYQELAKQLHHQEADIAMDFHIFDDTDKDLDSKEQGVLNVISFSVLQKDIQQRVQIAKSAAFEPKVIDLDYLALAGATNFLIDNASHDIISIFHLGNNTITLIVIDKSNVIYSKETTIEQHLSKFLSYDLDKIEKSKSENLISINDNRKDPNELDNQQQDDNSLIDNKYTDVLESGETLEQFTEQCNNLLQFFYSSQTGKEIKTIVLSGCYNIDKKEVLQSSLQEKFSTEVKFLDFNEKLILSDLAKSNRILQNISPDMMVSLGIALRGFDNDQN